jgi:ankyrin repeat protein
MNNRLQISFQGGINHLDHPRDQFPFSPLNSGVQRQHVNDSLLRLGMHAIKIDTMISTLPPELFTTQLVTETKQDFLNSGSTDLLTRVALYLISNNLIPRDYDNAFGIVTWFEAQDVSHFQGAIQFLISQNDTTSMAVLENLFEYAILAKNVVFTKKLLTISKSHWMPEDRDRSDWIPTPDRLRKRLNEALKEACICQDLQLAKSWINLGANTESIYLPAILKAIQHRHMKKNSSRPPGQLRIELDWVRMLLEKGATVCDNTERKDHQYYNMGCIEIAWGLRDSNLVLLLLEDPWGGQYCQNCTDFYFEEIGINRSLVKLIIKLLLKKYQGRLFNNLSLESAVELESLEAIENRLSPKIIASSPAWRSNMDTLLAALGQYRETRYRHPDFGASDMAYDDSLSFMNSTNAHHDIEFIAQNVASTRDLLELDVTIIKTLLALPLKLQSLVRDHCLHVAVEYDYLSLSIELVNEGARVGENTLRLCVERRSPEMVLILCNPPLTSQLSYISVQDWGQIWTAALRRGDVSIFRALSSSGVQAHICPSRLVLEEKSYMLTLLNDLGLTILLQPIDVELRYHHNISLLEAAIRVKNMDLVETLLPSATANGDEGAMRAAVQQGIDMVEKLLSANGIFSPYQNSQYLLPALHLAIRRNDSVIVQRLLQSKARVDSLFDDRGRINWGSSNIQFEEEKYAFDDSVTSTALETAIEADREPDLMIFRQIIPCIADFNAPIRSADRRWATPLILAIRHCNRGAVDLLLQVGASADTPTTHLLIETPLQAAVKTGDPILVQRLIGLGASVNAPPKKSKGFTALQIAAREGFIPIASTLLSAGADVNASGSQSGGTAIEQSALLGRVDMIHLLVQHGAQLIGPGEAQFKRAKQLATKNGHRAACQLLESLRDEQLSTFNNDCRNVIQIPSGIFSVSEDQSLQTEIPGTAQHSALNGPGWNNLSQNDFLFNTDTFDGGIITAADVNTIAEFTSFMDS